MIPRRGIGREEIRTIKCRHPNCPGTAVWDLGVGKTCKRINTAHRGSGGARTQSTVSLQKGQKCITHLSKVPTHMFQVKKKLT